MNKKVLLGTTALVAAGFAVSDAKAADPVSLGIGGYSYWAGFFADYDADAAGDVAIRHESEVHFKGSTVLDNGLEVGVRIELEGEEHSGDQIDESWAYVSGSFGTLRVGNDDPAAIQLATAAPYPDYIFNGNSPYFSPSGAYLTTFPADADNAKLIYFTPALGGLSMAVSYSPEGDDGGQAGAGTGNGNTAYQRAIDGESNELSVGIRYDGSMGMDMGIAAAAGWTQHDDDTDGMNVGLSLSMGSFGVGGSYYDMDKDVDDPEATYDIGATYSDGPMTLGVSWISQDMNADLYRLQLAYDLGAGVSVNSAIGIDQPEADNDETTFVGTSLIVNF